MIGKVTREDHGDLANAMIRLYAESKKARERQGMGFKLSRWDEQLLTYSELFENRMMNLEVNYPIEEALDLGWKTLSECFSRMKSGSSSRWSQSIGRNRRGVMATLKLSKTELRSQGSSVWHSSYICPTLQVEEGDVAN